MPEVTFEEIEQSIKDKGWFYFGNKHFECPGEVGESQKKFYMENNKLPPPCDNCYKALIFWGGGYSETNLNNFFKMINSFQFEYRGKLHKQTVVFYFRYKDEMLNFIEYLETKMQEYDVRGRTQWRRACKKYEDLNPKLWRNAKEFIPDMVGKGDTKLSDF